MAAYHKVEVSLNTNAVEVGIPSPQTVNVVVPLVGPAGPAGPAGEQGPPGEVSGSIAWDNVSGKPSTFTPSAHTHALSELTQSNAQSEDLVVWDGVWKAANPATWAGANLSAADVGAASATHAHVAADITDFTAAVEAVSPPADWDTLANKPASFTPSAHSSTHHTGGTDALAAHQINGQTIFSTASATYSTDQTLTANRARQLIISNTNAGGINITLPSSADGTLVGDTYVFIGGGTVSGPIVVRRINVLSPLIYETLATITATGEQYRFRASGGTTGGWTLVPVDSHTHSATQITGLATVATTGDYDDLTDKPTIPSASSATPSALGTAAAGTSTDFSRADHVHAMPSAEDVGLGSEDYPTFAGLTVTSFGGQGTALVFSNDEGILSTDEPSAGRDALGLGTAATAASTDFAAASHTHSEAPTTVAGFLSAADKTKLDGIASGAEVNVQANWTEANSGSDAFILNKPTLGTAAAASTSDFAAASHTHELTALDATGATNGHVLTANGSNGVTFAALPASGVTGAASSASDVLGVSGSDITGVDATADRIVFWDDSASKLAYLEAGSGLSLSGTTLSATGGGVTTGSVDNAIIRADGTGGSTSQSSDLVIDDATTSTQANVAIVNTHSETNSSLVLTPKGTGAFIVGPKPDGTASGGGNARGLKAVDLSFQRAAATQVASGQYSMVLGGDRCTASGTTAIAGGERATASAAYTVALGRVSTASGNAAAVIGGQDNTASGAESIVVGGDTNTASAYAAAAFGNFGLADRSGLIAQGNGRFAANGDAQWIHMVLRAKTTTNSAVELLINNGRTTNGRLTCPSGKIISGIINIHGVKSDGTASAHYVRQFQVKNVGGTSSYPYTAATVGTDYASSTSITFNDPDTNGDALSVSVTGIASETWRWTAHVSAVETTYGS